MKLEPILSQPSAPLKGAKIEVMRDPLLSGADNNKMVVEREQKKSARERAIDIMMKGQESASSSTQMVNGLSSDSPALPKEDLDKAVLSEGDEVSSPEAALEAPAAEPVQEKAPDPLSSQYALLARKERAMRAREATIRAREAELEAKRQAEAAPKAPAFDESKYISKERLMEDTFGTLGELGLGYDELTERALNAPKPNELALLREIKALKQEMQNLKGESESTKKSFEESQKQQYDQALNQITRDANMLIKSDPNFELIKEAGATQDVVKLIEKTFNEDGYLMTVEEAAQMVEDYLLEREVRLARTKKVQQKLAPQAQVTKQQVSQPAQPSQLKTLTNSVSTSRKLSARERAILAFEGKKIS